MLSKVSRNFTQISFIKKPNVYNIPLFTLQKALRKFSDTKNFEADPNIPSTLKASDFLVINTLSSN